MSKSIDITGKKFYRLTVIKKVESHVSPCGSISAMYLCRCDCGNEIVVQARNLRNGNTKSCGCQRADSCGERHTIHGYAKRENGERLYNVWKSMVGRCKNPKYFAYKDYGGRGITVCEEWVRSYENFREWAYVNGYDENAKRGECTIDRIDNDGNYEPSNCRWVGMKVQANNTRKTKKSIGVTNELDGV